MQEVVIGKDRVAVGELIGKGGEGEIYSIRGRSGQALKIYNAGLRAQREDKVRAMVGEQFAIATDLVAYPGEVVTDRRGQFLGFVMRLVSGYKPLHELYSPKSRIRHFAKSDYRFIVSTALNVARAVGKVHQTGCVIGDLNHSSVLVAPDATVALIDADSFQFTRNGTTYPCVVGVPDFTPPELHGKQLSSVKRTVEHDNFGLAIAIFHLLFMGRHPYAGRYKGPDISLGESIAQNRFAFSLSRRDQTQTQPPPGAMTLNLFPTGIAQAFERAFGVNPAERPSALTWIDVLKTVLGSLNRCNRVRTHYYPSAAGRCVWCELTRASGFDMFPDLVTADDIPTDSRGTEQAIREIEAFQFPSAAALLPNVGAPRGASQTLRQARDKRRMRTLLAIMLLAGALAGFIAAPAVGFAWIGIAVWGGAMFFGGQLDTGQFQDAYKSSDEQVQNELDNIVRRHYVGEFLRMQDSLKKVIKTYKNHDAQLASALQALKSSRETRQRQAYLEKFPVRSAKISGIGPAKTATLISFGIETAGDVEKHAVMAVPGFGVVMTDKLLNWRRTLESRFQYNPAANAQDTAEQNNLRKKFAADKATLESTIRSGLVALRNAQTGLAVIREKAINDQGLNQALLARARAEHDLRELGVTVPASTVTLRTTQPPITFQVPTGAAQTRPVTGRARCPRCGSLMQQRQSRHGRFWGCSRFPKCRGTRNL